MENMNIKEKEMILLLLLWLSGSNDTWMQWNVLQLVCCFKPKQNLSQFWSEIYFNWMQFLQTDSYLNFECIECSQNVCICNSKSKNTKEAGNLKISSLRMGKKPLDVGLFEMHFDCGIKMKIFHFLHGISSSKTRMNIPNPETHSWNIHCLP